MVAAITLFVIARIKKSPHVFGFGLGDLLIMFLTAYATLFLIREFIPTGHLNTYVASLIG